MAEAGCEVRRSSTRPMNVYCARIRARYTGPKSKNGV